MDEVTNKIYAKLAEFEREIKNLREGYLIVGKRYSESIESLKLLTLHSREAAERAAASAIKSAAAARSAATAAATAVAHQAEEVSLQASAHASGAAKRAAEAAAEAVKLAHQASESARSVDGRQAG